MAVKCLQCGATIRYYEHFATSGCTNPECPYNIDNLISRKNGKFAEKIQRRGQTTLE